MEDDAPTVGGEGDVEFVREFALGDAEEVLGAVVAHGAERVGVAGEFDVREETVHRVGDGVAGEEEGEEPTRGGERERERARDAALIGGGEDGGGGAPRGGHRRARERALRALAPIHDASADFPRERVRGVRLGESVETQARPAVSEDVTVHSRHAPRRHRDPASGRVPPGATRDRSNARARSAERRSNEGHLGLDWGSTRPSPERPNATLTVARATIPLATGDAFTRESNRRPTLCLAARCCGPRARRGSA